MLLLRKQKGNGEGTIYYSDSLNKWVAQYIDPQTKQRKTIKQKKKESITDFKNRFKNIMHEINNNTYISNSDISLYNILKDYIDNKYKSGITGDRAYRRNKNTLTLLSKCCKNFIHKPIQKVTIQDIKSGIINLTEQEYIDSKTHEKVSRAYSQNVIYKLYTMLKKGFQIATSERIITYNIFENETIKKPHSKKETKKVEVLTIEEERKLTQVLKSNDHKYHNIILLALATGMRIGEILALTVDNVDLTNNVIIIDKTLTRDVNDHVILGKTTKKQEQGKYFLIMLFKFLMMY